MLEFRESTQFASGEAYSVSRNGSHIGYVRAINTGWEAFTTEFVSVADGFPTRADAAKFCKPPMEWRP